MTLVESEVLAEITRRIVERVHPQRVVLFGSRARGDARDDSDFDILVVAPSEKPRWQRTVPVYTDLADLRLPRNVDVVWWTPQEIAEWQGVRMHFVTTALREGKVLYG